MLKKAGIAAAVAAAGLLALSPLAFAKDKEHQDNHQTSFQGEGKGNGKNLGSGKAFQECGLFLVGPPGSGNETYVGSAGACNSNESQQEQVEKQRKSND